MATTENVAMTTKTTTTTIASMIMIFDNLIILKFGDSPMPTTPQNNHWKYHYKNDNNNKIANMIIDNIIILQFGDSPMPTTDTGLCPLSGRVWRTGSSSWWLTLMFVIMMILIFKMSTYHAVHWYVHCPIQYHNDDEIPTYQYQLLVTNTTSPQCPCKIPRILMAYPAGYQYGQYHHHDYLYPKYGWCITN